MEQKMLKGTPLSNFSYIGIIVNGKFWKTAEHLYQAMKAKDGLESSWAEVIRVCPSAVAAKRRGKTIPLREDWDVVKVATMREILELKFQKSLPHRTYLLNYDEEIIEYNYWHDNFWGQCTCFKCRNIPGKNWLGALLMEIRQQYR